MNKSDLIEKVKELAELESNAVAEHVVAACFAGIEVGLSEDGEVQLDGFGTFHVRYRRPRWGRNVVTGEKIKIGSSKTVTFVYSKG